MPRPHKSSKNESHVAKLKRLERLARQTAKLSLDIFGDIIAGHSIPVPPKPKKHGTLMMSSIPVPPKPKLEALAELAYGARTIEVSAEALGKL